MIYTERLDDLLILEDNFSSTSKFVTLDDAVSFFDSLNSHRHPELIQETIQFVDRLSTNRVVFKRTFSDTLVFTEKTHPKTRIVVMNEFLFLHDFLLGPEFKQLHDTLLFVDSFTGSAGHGLRDNLVLTEQVKSKLVAKYALTDSFTLVDAITVWKNNPWFSTYPVQEP